MPAPSTQLTSQSWIVLWGSCGPLFWFLGLPVGFTELKKVRDLLSYYCPYCCQIVKDWKTIQSWAILWKNAKLRFKEVPSLGTVLWQWGVLPPSMGLLASLPSVWTSWLTIVTIINEVLCQEEKNFSNWQPPYLSYLIFKSIYKIVEHSDCGSVLII